MKIAERGSETIFGSSSSAESICLKWSMQPVDDVVWCTYIYTKSTLNAQDDSERSHIDDEIGRKKEFEAIFYSCSNFMDYKEFYMEQLRSEHFLDFVSHSSAGGCGMCYVCAA